MRTLYARLEVESKLNQGIIGIDTEDPACDETYSALRKLGIEFVHEYSWPGDGVYVCVKIHTTEQLDALHEIGTVTPIDPNTILHRGKTVLEEFEDKHGNG